MQPLVRDWEGGGNGMKVGAYSLPIHRCISSKQKWYVSTRKRQMSEIWGGGHWNRFKLYCGGKTSQFRHKNTNYFFFVVNCFDQSFCCLLLHVGFDLCAWQTKLCLKKNLTIAIYKNKTKYIESHRATTTNAQIPMAWLSPVQTEPRNHKPVFSKVFTTAALTLSLGWGEFTWTRLKLYCTVFFFSFWRCYWNDILWLICNLKVFYLGCFDTVCCLGQSGLLIIWHHQLESKPWICTIPQINSCRLNVLQLTVLYQAKHWDISSALKTGRNRHAAPFMWNSED